MIIKLHLKDQGDTAGLGACLANLLAPKDVILFMGDLGAGKTFLIKEIAKNMGIDTRLVTSPTFSIVHTYEHPAMTIVHADLYRLGKYADLNEIGLIEQILDGNGCGLIEWGDFLSEEDREGVHILELRLYFPNRPDANESERFAEISTKDRSWQKRLNKLQKWAQQEGLILEGTSS